MKDKLEAAYTCVGRGWWPLLDKYLPQIWEIDPNCDLIIKEKYATLRIQPYKVSAGVSRNKIYAIANKAEKDSETVCERCGAPGSPHLDGFWLVTLCDNCFAGGRCTPIEDFPEDGLHPETEQVIDEYLLSLAEERTKAHGFAKGTPAKDVYNSLGIVPESINSFEDVKIE